MRETQKKNLFKGILEGKDGVEISILQYADGTLFFGEATMSNVKAIKAMLRNFELVSDLKINFAKSIFGAFGRSDQWVRFAAGYLNYRLLSLPFSYQGNPRRNEIRDPIISKCERKLSKWKQRNLSFGERVTSIKSVLNSILIFFFSFFRVPKKVVDRLVQLQQSFLWGDGKGQRKLAWVKWDTICLPKEKGGLGVRDLASFNRALLCKWHWNMFHHTSTLRAKVLKSKYGGWRNLDEARRNHKESIWWRDLSFVCGSKEEGGWFNEGVKWKIGCGLWVKFCEDRRREDRMLLMGKYQRLYCISQQQHHTIQQMDIEVGESWDWNFEWWRMILEGEMELAASFMEDIEELRIQPNQQDRWIWKGYMSGLYSMGSGYHWLNEVVADENDDRAFTIIWNMKIPSKVAHFVWRLVRDRLPTRANLRRRNVLLDEYYCLFCSSQEEDASHTFFSCKRIMPLWWESLAWTETVIVFPSSPKEHFLQHSYCKAPGIIQNRWWIWGAALTWCAFGISEIELYFQMRSLMDKNRWRMQFSSAGYG